MHILENRTASFLWECLEAAGDTGKSQDELIVSLTDRFDVASSVAAHDTKMFLEQLIAAGIADVSRSS